MRASTAAILIFLLTPTAYPQGKLVEVIEVRVVNVDVVVRDRAGNPVRGLTKDDFELYEDRVKQTITNLYEVRREEASQSVQAGEAQSAGPSVPIELRQRRLLLFVDSSSIQYSQKQSVLDAAEKFVNQRMQPEDQAMVVSWRLGVHVVSPFTSDKKAVKRAIDSLRQVAPAGESQQSSIGQIKRDIQDLIRLAEQNTLMLSWPQAYKQAMGLCDLYAQRLTVQQEAMLAALERISSNLGGLEGKKVLLFIGENLTERPGSEIYRYVENEFSPHMKRDALPDLQMLTGAAGNRTPQEIDNVAARASENGVAIYAIGAGQTDSEFSAENDSSVDTAEAFSRVASTASALNAMTGSTGGVAITHTSNFDLAFDTISRDLDSYYSLGYKPIERASKPRRIVVKAKNPAYTVRSRERVVLKSTDDQMSDHVIANLYADSGTGAWPISVRTGPPARDGGHFTIPVQVIMPSTITLLPQDEKLVGGFILYFVVGTDDGNASDVMRRPQGLGIPPAAEKAIRAKPMTYNTAIRVKPGESVLSVGIVDQLSGATGFARTKIIAR
jgi:VWFA-related protein